MAGLFWWTAFEVLQVERLAHDADAQCGSADASELFGCGVVVPGGPAVGREGHVMAMNCPAARASPRNRRASALGHRGHMC